MTEATSEGRYLDGLSPQPRQVTLRLQGAHLVIETAEGEVLWPIEAMRALPDPVGSLRSFSCRAAADARLWIAQGALRDSLARQVGVERAARRHRTAVFASVCLVFLLAVSFATVVLAPGVIVPLMPAAWDKALGTQVVTSPMRKEKICSGEAGNAGLGDLVMQLALAGASSRCG